MYLLSYSGVRGAEVLHDRSDALLVSRELLELVIEHADDEVAFPPERWAATFRSHAQQILKRLSDYLGYSPPPLLERMAADAQKI